jgi:hypothetical protein
VRAPSSTSPTSRFLREAPAKVIVRNFAITLWTRPPHEMFVKGQAVAVHCVDEQRLNPRLNNQSRSVAK